MQQQQQLKNESIKGVFHLILVLFLSTLRDTRIAVVEELASK
jgi:hypothetical protein